MSKISRRQALKLIGLTAAGSALAACTTATPSPTTAPASPTDTSAAPGATSGPTATTAPTNAVVVPTPTKGKPVTITLVESWFGVPQYQESVDPVMKAISQKMQSEGLNIEIKSMILAGHDTKYPLLYSAGADFTFAFDAPWYKMTSLMDQGALAPLEDLINQNGPKLLEEITPKIYGFNFMKGHLYGVPAAYSYTALGGTILREDLRKKYNAPAPTSAGGLPSLEPFLQAIKDNEKTLIPYALTYTQPTTDLPNGKHPYAFGLDQFNDGYGVRVEDIFNGTTLTNIEDQGSFIDAANLTRSWHEKGYVPQQDLPLSAATQNVFTDYFLAGKTASYGEADPTLKYFDYNKQLKAAFPDAEAHGYELGGALVGKYKALGQLTQWNFMVFNANAPEEQKVAGIQFFNWLASSQDNLDLWLMGIDGVNYKKEDNLTFSEIPGTDATRNYRRQWYVGGISGRFQRQPSDLPQDSKDYITFTTTESNFLFNPYEHFQVDTKAIQTVLAQVSAAYAEGFHDIYTGQTPVADAVKKLASTMDAAGRQQLKDAVQKQFDDWRAANPNG